MRRKLFEEVGGERRRSARIWALEEARKNRPKSTNGGPSSLQSQNSTGTGLFRVGGSPPIRRRGRKKKRLEDVFISSAATDMQRQEGENTNGDASIGNDQAFLSSLQYSPERRILESVLDILQRRDTREIFAEPVDPDEVDEYYSVIKEPMDFGTMRAKLHEGMYTSLEQFERDVFLIFNNAMLFNASTTVFYKEACALHELAQRVFEALKIDPENLEMQFSQTRRRAGRKPQTDAGNLRPKLDGTYLRRNAQTYLGSSSSIPYVHITSGSRDGRNFSFFGPESCQTYRPWSSLLSTNESIVSDIYNKPKQLAPINLGNIGYEESLMRFAKDLGPTAQMVANRKLGKLPVEASNFQSPIPAPTMNTPSWIRAPDLSTEPAFLCGVSKGPLVCALLGESPIDPKAVNYANQQLGVGGDVYGVGSIHSSGYGNGRMDIDKTAFVGDMSSIYGNMGSNSLFKNGLLGALTSNSYETMENSQLSKGKMICTDNNTEPFYGAGGENVTYPNKHVQFQLDPYVPAPRIEDLNYPAVIPNSSSNNYTPMDMMLESSQPSNQLLPAQLNANTHTGLLQLLSGGSSCLNPSFLPVNAANTGTTSLPSFANFGSVNSNHEASSSRANLPQDWNQPSPWSNQAIQDFPHLQSIKENQQLDLALQL